MLLLREPQRQAQRSKSWQRLLAHTPQLECHTPSRR